MPSSAIRLLLVERTNGVANTEGVEHRVEALRPIAFDVPAVAQP